MWNNSSTKEAIEIQKHINVIFIYKDIKETKNLTFYIKTNDDK